MLSGSQVELKEALEFEQTGAHILFSLFSPLEYCCVCTWWSHAEPEARDLFYMHEDILLPASSSDKLDVECGDVSTEETHSVYCLWVEPYSFFSFRISSMSCHGPGHSHILLVLDWQSIDMRWYLRLKRPLVNYLSPSSESPWRGPYLPSRLCIITYRLAVQADASLHTIWFGKRTKHILLNIWIRDSMPSRGCIAKPKIAKVWSLPPCAEGIRTQKIVRAVLPPRKYRAPSFLISLCPYLDLHYLNCTLRAYRFIMLMFIQIVSQIRSGEWFVMIDLKNTYFQILPNHRKLLRFTFGGEVHQYRVEWDSTTQKPLHLSHHCSGIIWGTPNRITGVAVAQTRINSTQARDKDASCSCGVNPCLCWQHQAGPGYSNQPIPKASGS